VPVPRLELLAVWKPRKSNVKTRVLRINLFAGSRRQTGEAEDWVQLDCVRSNARLAVLEVPEADTDDTRLSAEANRGAGIPHLLAPVVRRGRGTGIRIRSLGDDVLPAILEHQMQVLIGLGLYQRDGGEQAVNPALERKPRRRQLRRARQPDQVRHRRHARGEQGRPVLQGLDQPALLAADDRPLSGERSRLAWSGGTGGHGRERGQQEQDEHASAHAPTAVARSRGPGQPRPYAPAPPASHPQG